MRTAFGLDLAGYSTCGTSLCQAIRADPGSITVTVYRDTCLAEKVDGRDLLADVNEAEISVIRRCCQCGPLIVDVPIDLQELPAPDSAEFVWQLVERPVDRAFRAMPPLADRIGAYVARMQRLWAILRQGGDDPLGNSLFETYPAACLELLDINDADYRTGYKGRARFEGARWLGEGAKVATQQKKNDKFASILTELEWKASQDMTLGHDEFDAAICGIVGVADESEALYGKRLKDVINQRLRRKRNVPKDHESRYEPPRGYRLLEHCQAQIDVVFGPLDALQICGGELS